MDTALLKELGATEDTTLRQVKALAQQKVEELDRIITEAQEKRQVFASLLGLWNKTGEVGETEATSNGVVTSPAALEIADTASEVKAAPKAPSSTKGRGGSKAKASKGEESAAPSKSKKTTKAKTTSKRTKSDQPKQTEDAPPFDFNALLPKFEGKSYQDAFVQILESEPENEFSVGDIVKEAYGDQLQGNSFMRVCQIVGREMTRGIEQGLWVKSSQKPPRYASKTA